MPVACFIADDGAQLAYRDHGKGLPLLALSGLTRNGQDFDYLAPYLDNVRLIRPDYRGRGKSAWTGAQTYTIQQEAADALALLDHLGIDKAAILGTSRGGLIGMFLAATAHDRLMGLCLNDIGPVIDAEGLARIGEYIGRNPASRSHEDLAARLPTIMLGFSNVSPTRWLEEAKMHYIAENGKLRINYDPALREAFSTSFKEPLPDAWPLFDLCAGLPLALIRGANSDLLSRLTADEMRRRRPDMIYAETPDRAHIPFLDEPESLQAIENWLALLR